VEYRSLLSDRSQSCAGSNRPSSQLTVWTSQTFRGCTCPPNLIMPHRCHSVAFQTRVGHDVQATLRTALLSVISLHQCLLPLIKKGLSGFMLSSEDELSHVYTRDDVTVLDDYALATLSRVLRWCRLNSDDDNESTVQ